MLTATTPFIFEMCMECVGRNKFWDMIDLCSKRARLVPDHDEPDDGDNAPLPEDLSYMTVVAQMVRMRKKGWELVVPPWKETKRGAHEQKGSSHAERFKGFISVHTILQKFDYNGLFILFCNNSPNPHA